MYNNLTPAERLSAAESDWLTRSTEEQFYFAMFQEPALLRRPSQFSGVLASLKFGTYQDLQRQWVDDERAVWLEMIVSEQPGAGGRFLDRLTFTLSRFGLALLGTPTPLRPRDWDPERRLIKKEELIGWYLKHRFKIVQDGSDTRVVHVPMSSMLKTNFTL